MNETRGKKTFWLYILGPIIGGVLAALLYDRSMTQTQGPAKRAFQNSRSGI
jgi:hypothetical protein